MEEIKKLDDKYLVLKWKDIESLKLSQYLDAVNFAKAVQKNVNELRKDEGKSENHYVVLNLDDPIDLDYLISELKNENDLGCFKQHITHVSSIAVDLVNAILKAKKDA